MKVSTLLGISVGIAVANILLEGPSWILWFFLSPLPFVVAGLFGPLTDEVDQ